MSLPRWCLLLSSLSEDGSGYAMNAPADAGNGVVLAPVTKKSTGQLFQITSDGRMLLPTPGFLVGVNSGGVLVKTAQAVPNDAGQQWNFTTAQLIQNRASGQYACVSGGSPEGDPLIVTGAGPVDSSYEWMPLPANPLDAILAQPPLQFPQFTGEQLTAYDYIESKLVPPLDGVDLRSEYTNLDAQLSDYLSEIEGMQYPSNIGVSQANWDAVTQELIAELADAGAVQSLFANYTQYHNDLNNDQGDILTKLTGDVNMQSGTEVSGMGVALGQGLLYTVLESVPEIGGVLGNLVNTAISAGLTAHSLSVTPFQVLYSDLWGALSVTFDEVLTQAGAIETKILSDWGMLQNTAALTTKPPGPDSLNWPADMTGDLVTASGPGFSLLVMQILMPAIYQIYMYQDDDDDEVKDVPSNAQMVEPIGNGIWAKYWIASSTDWDNVPSNAALDDVWNNGGVTADFFHGNNGWNFAVVWVYDTFVYGANNVVVTLSNQTQNALYGTATVGTGTGWVVGPAQQTILPYTSAQLAAALNTTQDLLILNIQIVDPNQNGATVASFTVMQSISGLEGAWPSVSSVTFSDGYALSAPICNQAAIQGGLKDGYPAAVQVTIWPAPVS